MRETFWVCSIPTQISEYTSANSHAPIDGSVTAEPAKASQMNGTAIPVLSNPYPSSWFSIDPRLRKTLETALLWIFWIVANGGSALASTLSLMVHFLGETIGGFWTLLTKIGDASSRGKSQKRTAVLLSFLVLASGTTATWVEASTDLSDLNKQTAAMSSALEKSGWKQELKGVLAVSPSQDNNPKLNTA